MIKYNLKIFSLLTLIFPFVILSNSDTLNYNLCTKCKVSKSASKNGHRGGGDVCEFPENSLKALKGVATCIQGNGPLTYIEFDINSTLDNNLVVFHGPQLWKFFGKDGNNIPQKTIEELLDFTNKTKFKKINIYNLTVEKIKLLQLSNTEKIPTFNEYLEAITNYNVEVTLRPDIKHIDSVNMLNFIERLKTFKYEQELTNHFYGIEIYITSSRWNDLSLTTKHILCNNTADYDINNQIRWPLLHKKTIKKCKKL